MIKWVIWPESGALHSGRQVHTTHFSHWPLGWNWSSGTAIVLYIISQRASHHVHCWCHAPAYAVSIHACLELAQVFVLVSDDDCLVACVLSFLFSFLFSPFFFGGGGGGVMSVWWGRHSEKKKRKNLLHCITIALQSHWKTWNVKWNQLQKQNYDLKQKRGPPPPPPQQNNNLKQEETKNNKQQLTVTNTQKSQRSRSKIPLTQHF